MKIYSQRNREIISNAVYLQLSEKAVQYQALSLRQKLYFKIMGWVVSSRVYVKYLTHWELRAAETAGHCLIIFYTENM